MTIDDNQPVQITLVLQNDFNQMITILNKVTGYSLMEHHRSNMSHLDIVSHNFVCFHLFITLI